MHLNHVADLGSNQKEHPRKEIQCDSCTKKTRNLMQRRSRRHNFEVVDVGGGGNGGGVDGCEVVHKLHKCACL